MFIRLKGDHVTHPHSLKDKKYKNEFIENMNLKMQIAKEGVGICSLACNTLGVKGCDGALGWGLGRMTSGLIIHTDLHKPNKKLVNA